MAGGLSQQYQHSNELLACMFRQPFRMHMAVNRFIRSLVKPGEKTAQSYFNARGWTASISANIFGFTAPLSSKSMGGNLNPIVGPWLATHIWEYYDYTRQEISERNRL